MFYIIKKRYNDLYGEKVLEFLTYFGKPREFITYDEAVNYMITKHPLDKEWKIIKY